MSRFHGLVIRSCCITKPYRAFPRALMLSSSLTVHLCIRAPLLMPVRMSLLMLLLMPLRMSLLMQVCLGKWSEHARDYYNCNKAPPKGLYDSDAAAANKHELAVYAFYSERFNENMRSARIAAENRPKIAGLAEQLMVVAGASATETDFMKRAQEVSSKLQLRAMPVRGCRVAAWCSHILHPPPLTSWLLL